MDPAAVSRWRRLTRAVVYAVVVAVPLGMLAFLVRTKYDPLVTLDQDIIVAATDYTRGHPRFRSFVETWEVISQPWVMYLFLGLPVSLYVWFGKHLRTRAWWALATMAAGWAIAAVLKLLVRRARPEIDDPIAQHAGFSFPSGHATNNAIVVTVVVLLMWPLVGTGLRRLLVGLGAVWVIVTCADRLYRGRPLPVRRHGRRAARVRADGRVVRGLCGLEAANPHRQHDERFRLMAFLTRWQEDTSRPTAKEAGRDLVVRALAPVVVWWLAVVGMGWLLTDGPLKDLGVSEDSVNKSLESSRTTFWDAVTLFFSWTGATVSIIGVCLVVVVLVWRRTKQWWYAVVPLIAISLQAMVFFFTTLLIDRERPDVEKLDDSPPTSSFPSGHTGAATGLYFTLALMALRITNPVLRSVVVSVCVAIPFLVATARLYRGMHHVSDLVVAIVNGSVAALLAWCWLRRDERSDGEDQTRA